MRRRTILPLTLENERLMEHEPDGQATAGGSSPPARRALARLLREPLVVFLLIGAGLFGLHALVTSREPQAEPSQRIVITSGDIEQLAQYWRLQWHREPTLVELKGLVDDHVREEVLYREAMAMGLDRDDTIIRRRLAQKLEFLTQDVAAVRVPTDPELAEYLEDHRERYRVPARVSFTHVFFDVERRGLATESEVRSAIDRLRAAGSTAAPDDLGDPFLLGDEVRDGSAEAIRRDFGDDFGAAVVVLEPGTWQGPIPSSYGWHAVHVTARTDSREPSLAEVREAVLRDWQDDHRRSTNEEVLRQLLARYEIVIESTAPPASEATR